MVRGAVRTIADEQAAHFGDETPCPPAVGMPRAEKLPRLGGAAPPRLMSRRPIARRVAYQRRRVEYPHCRREGLPVTGSLPGSLLRQASEGD